MLGTGRQARQRVGPALSAKRLRRHGELHPTLAPLFRYGEARCFSLLALLCVTAGRAGSSSRLDCAASSLAQRVVLCRDSLDLSLWLHLSVRLISQTRGIGAFDVLLDTDFTPVDRCRFPWRRSDHSFMRKLWLHVELFYQTYNMLYVLCLCAGPTSRADSLPHAALRGSRSAIGVSCYSRFSIVLRNSTDASLSRADIIMYILTTSMEDASFGLKGIHYFVRDFSRSRLAPPESKHSRPKTQLYRTASCSTTTWPSCVSVKQSSGRVSEKLTLLCRSLLLHPRPRQSSARQSRLLPHHHHLFRLDHGLHARECATPAWFFAAAATASLSLFFPP